MARVVKSSFGFKNEDTSQIQRFEAMLDRLKAMGELTFTKWSSDKECSYAVDAVSKVRMAFINGYYTALEGR